MNFLCWNCQGLGTPLTIQAIQALVAEERPSLMFLMETKNQEKMVFRLKRRLQFQNLFVVNPVGTAGGLALFWDNRILVTVESHSPHFVNAIGEYIGSGRRMRITFVYAPNDFQGRLHLWEELCQISHSNNLPWICAGDFNEILYLWEKVGMRVAENYHMKAFQDFLDACCLMDLESKGCTFTWANNREGDAYVKKRLDRAVCSMEWRVTFPEAEVYALLAIGSDHSPLLISLSPVQEKRKKEFKFEAFWLEEAECGEIVRDVWQKAEDTNDNLLTKMKRVSGELED